MGITERKERERENRRNEIIDAAERVFFRKGYENSSMDEVAAEAELSKGTLYLYFNSKEELLFSIDLRALNLLTNRIEAVASNGSSTLETVLAIGREYVNFAREYEDYFKILLYFEGNNQYNVTHQMYSTFCKQGKDPLAYLTDILERGMHDGSIRSDIKAPVLALCLWSGITGVLRLVKSKDFHQFLRGYSEEEFINAHITITLNGILAKD